MSIEVDNRFLQIDKISDDILTIAPNIVLRFNVALSKISSGKRYHYHREYTYSSKMSPDPLITIKRTFDYYLSFENTTKPDKGDKLFIRIGPSEILLVRKGFDIVNSWFNDKQFEHLYVRNGNKLLITSPVPRFRIHHLPQNKYIEFSPTIIEKGESEADRKPGINIDFGDGINIINISIERFMGLYYTISCFNMYQSAAILLNYVSRPPTGTNSFNLSSYQTNGRTLPLGNIACGAEGTNGRIVQSKILPQEISILE